MKEVRKSDRVVIELAQDLLGKGYKLYVDNWYKTFNRICSIILQTITLEHVQEELPSTFTTEFKAWGHRLQKRRLFYMNIPQTRREFNNQEGQERHYHIVKGYY